MNPKDTDLEYKIEEAFRLWLLDKATHGLDILCDVRHQEQDKSIENVDGTLKAPELALPVMILKATKLKQLTPSLNIHLCRLESHLWVAADDVPAPFLGRTPEQLYHQIAKAREDILQWDALASVLSAKVDNFLVNGVQEFDPTAKAVVDRHWTHRFDVLLWAQPSDGD